MKNYIYILITLACLLTACYPKYQAELAHAEQLLEAQPDSALSILQSIDATSINHKAEHAHYALLYTMALDKNAMDAYNTNDSLISIATQYYAKHGNDSIKALAYYYAGRVYENDNNTEQSIINFTLAAECVPSSSYYTIGLINGKLGELYQNQGNYDKAIELFEIGVDAFGKAGSKTNQAIAYSNISLCYNLKENYTKAMLNEQMAFDISISINDTIGILESHRGIINIRSYKGDNILQLKDELFAVFSKYNRGIVPSDAYSTLSDIYLQMHKLDSAKYYLLLDSNKEHLTLDDSLYTNYMLSDIEELAGNYQKALKYQKNVVSILDSIHNNEINSLIEDVAERYENKALTLQLVQQTKDKRLIITIAVLILLLSGATTYIVWRRYKTKQVEAQKKYEDDIILLHEAKLNLKLQHDSLIADIEKTNNSEIEAIGKIEHTIHSISALLEKVAATKNNPKKFVDEFIKTMQNSDKNTDAYAHLHFMANKRYYGIITHLTHTYNLTPAEADLCSMICLGFSNETIRVMHNHENFNSIYNRRRRLKLKINCEQDIDSFINSTIGKLANK